MTTRSTWPIDLGGAALACLLLCGTGWYTYFRPQTASSQIPEALSSVHRLDAELAQLRSTLEARATTRDKLRQSAEQLGRLPAKSPIEQNLRTITALAETHGVKVLEVLPLGKVSYPNALEVRFRVRAVAAYADQLRFLRSFQECSMWADVTYLRLAQRFVDPAELAVQSEADLTVSFFSATP